MSGSKRVENACLKLRELPRLSPEFNVEDFDKWTYAAMAFVDEFKIPDDLKLHIILPRLDAEGQAMIYRAGLHDWPSAETLLRRRVLSKVHGNNDHHYLDILDMRQQYNETMSDYAKRLLETAALSKPQANVNLPPSVVRDIFCEGVRNRLVRRRLAERPPRSFLEALKRAGDLQMALTEEETLDESSGFDLPDDFDCNLSVSSDGGLSEVSSPSGIGAAGRYVVQQMRHEIDPKVLKEVLEILKAARRSRTVRNYRRHLMLAQPGLSDEQKKMILETPEEGPAFLRIQCELDPWFFPFCSIRVGRPFFTFIIKMPKVGRWLSRLSGGRPVITPGVWLKRLKSLLARHADEEDESVKKIICEPPQLRV